MDYEDTEKRGEAILAFGDPCDGFDAEGMDSPEQG